MDMRLLLASRFVVAQIYGACVAYVATLAKTPKVILAYMHFTMTAV